MFVSKGWLREDSRDNSVGMTEAESEERKAASALDSFAMVIGSAYIGVWLDLCQLKSLCAARGEIIAVAKL